MSYRVSGDKTPCSAQDILEGLSCGRQGCPCQRSRERGFGNTHCPAHEDTAPSLTVKQTGNKALVHCKTGCNQRDVLDALDANYSLWLNPLDETIQPIKNGTAQQWPYVAEDGTVLAYHCRRDLGGGQKQMWWMRPDGRTSQGDIKPVNLPLYRSNDLRSNTGTLVLFCEGEKAVEAAFAKGYLAVSAAGGASQVDFGDCLEALRGRDVVLWPDADKAGLQFMQHLAVALEPLAKRVRWLIIPDSRPKDDAYDFFARGSSSADLDLLLEKTTVFGPEIQAALNGLPKVWTWQELLRTQFKPPSWILDEIIPEVGLAILGGKPKVGKSWLALQIAGAVASGDEVLSRHAKHMRVLYFAIEDKAPRIKSRGQLQGMDDEAEIAFADTIEPLDNGGMLMLETMIDTVNPKFVVIDTLASAKTGKTDENAAGQMADILNGLQNLAHKRNISILLVAHHRKDVTGDPGGDLRGSSAIAAAADMLISLIRKAPTYSLSVEGRDIADAEYRMDFEEYRWKLKGDAREMAKSEAEQQIFETLARIGESDAGQVAKEAGCHRTTAMRHLKDLEFQRKVQSEVLHPASSALIRVVYRITSGN